MGRRGKGDSEGDDDAVCNPHAALSISFPLCCLIMWHATHTLRHLFYSLHIVDDAVCNPHTASSISFSMLFDDMACNPHTVSSILFPPCCLMMQCATHTPHHLYLSLHVSFFFPSILLFDDMTCNPHAVSSI